MKTESKTYKENFNRYGNLLTDYRPYQSLYNRIKAIVDVNKIVPKKRKSYKITDSDHDDSNDENNNNEINNDNENNNNNINSNEDLIIQDSYNENDNNGLFNNDVSIIDDNIKNKVHNIILNF